MAKVDDARLALGGRLRELRVSARITGRAMAKEAGWEPSKVSKIEHGKQLPSEDDLTVWCRITDNNLALPDLAATLRNVNAAYMEWRRIAGTGHARRQRQSIQTEGASSLVRGYDCLLLPGLLQTRDYAEAVLTRCIRFLGGPDDLSEALEARMERQRVLREGLHRFHFLIGESALYTSVGDDQIRRGQLHHLLDSMRLARLIVGVVPNTAEFFYETTNFLFYDTKLVQVETISAELSIRQPRELVLYERAFTALANRAAYGDQARALIHKALAVSGESHRQE
ncbi:helix-turn-helix domain-containing protein [Nocardia acidivorans]|uniref:helix-turn-helix domain-containing protein n=1 Tax=Nocardia acidivorans TaxID=404580 RepID=UPI00082D7A1E|nr:helix-turn-helix transcriptional regulator [Nocardia acidivorans]